MSKMKISYHDINLQKNGKSPVADIVRGEAVESAPESTITAPQKIINKVISQKKLSEVAEIGIFNQSGNPTKTPYFLKIIDR